MSTAITPYQPTNLSEAMCLADTMHKSGMFAKYRSPEQVFAIIAAGAELGMPPMQSLRSLYFYDGKVTMSADLIVALVKRSPTCKYIRIVETTASACEMETQRDGDPSPTKMRWTIQDAQAAGLTGKDNWKKFPREMLRARCGVALCRAVYPELAMGLYDSDSGELETGRASVDAGPALRIALPAAPAPSPPAIQDAEVVPDDLDMETSLRLSLIQNELSRCTTQKEIDAVTYKGTAENFEGRAMTRMLSMFKEARARVGFE